MKINPMSITVMLGLLAVVSIMVPTQTQIFGSTEGEPDILRIREVGNNDNEAEMAKMTVKEGNQPSEKEDDFELDPEENAIFVPQGKNVEVTDDENFFRAVVTRGDNDKQIPISQQGIIDLKGLQQGFYYLDVVIQDGNRKIAYEAILFIGPDNDTNRDTVNKEVNRVDKEVTITKRVTNFDKIVQCGKDQKFNDRTKKCENIPPPCKPNEVRDNTGKCVPRLTPPVGGPTPPITGPGGEKPTCLTTGNKPGRISSNAQTCTPFDGSQPTRIRGPIDVIVPLPIPCIEGQTPERNNCVATTPPGTQFPQCITPGNPPNCVPGPDTKPGGTVGTACMTIDGKPGRVAANGACNPSGEVPPGGVPLCRPGQQSSPQNPCVPQAGPATPATPTPTPPPEGAPAGLTPGSTDLIGSPCTLPDGKPGKVAGAVGDMNCEPTGIGGATTAPTGPVGSDCSLPGGGTGGKVMNTNNGIACVGTPTPRDALPVEPTPPQTPTDTGEPRPSCTTPDGQPGMMGMSEGRLSCTPIEDQRPTISSLTPEPEELPAPTDPTELANFCVDNPQHSACQTPTTPPDQTSQLTPVPEPNVPDAQTETEDPDAALFGTDQPQTGGQGGTTDMPAGGGETPDIVCEGPNNPPGCTPPEPDPDTGAVCESGFGTPPNCMTQDEFCADNQDDPRCQPDDGGNGPEPSPSPLPSPGQTQAERGLGGFDPTQCDTQFEVWDGTKCVPLETEQPFEQGAAPLNCEAQGMVEEDGECVLPEPEVEDVPQEELVPQEDLEIQSQDDEAAVDSSDDQQSFDQGSDDAEAPSDDGEGGEGNE